MREEFDCSRLNTAPGRFTTYRLVLWVLAVLAGYSLLLEVLGWLTSGLPEMIMHLTLCLGLGYASNRAPAAVLHVRPHSESSLIRGLLLDFLFRPTQFSICCAPAWEQAKRCGSPSPSPGAVLHRLHAGRPAHAAAAPLAATDSGSN